jgi:hypothetical protein
MRTMKRLVIVFSAMVAVLPLAACGGGQKSTQTTNTSTSTTTQGTAPLHSHHRRTAMAEEGGAMAGAAAGTIPRCGAVKAVWVNTRTHVYHEPGDPYYGRTKNGKYLCPSAAVAEGDHLARGKGGSAANGEGGSP